MGAGAGGVRARDVHDRRPSATGRRTCTPTRSTPAPTCGLRGAHREVLGELEAAVVDCAEHRANTAGTSWRSRGTDRDNRPRRCARSRRGAARCSPTRPGWIRAPSSVRLEADLARPGPRARPAARRRRGPRPGPHRPAGHDGPLASGVPPVSGPTFLGRSYELGVMLEALDHAVAGRRSGRGRERRTRDRQDAQLAEEVAREAGGTGCRRRLVRRSPRERRHRDAATDHAARQRPGGARGATRTGRARRRPTGLGATPSRRRSSRRASSTSSPGRCARSVGPATALHGRGGRSAVGGPQLVAGHRADRGGPAAYVPVLLVVTVRPIDQPSPTPGLVERLGELARGSRRRGGCRSAGWTLDDVALVRIREHPSRTDGPGASGRVGGSTGPSVEDEERLGRVRARPHGRQPVLRAGAGGVARRRGPTGLGDRHDLADVVDLGRRARRGGGRHPPACESPAPVHAAAAADRRGRRSHVRRGRDRSRLGPHDGRAARRPRSRDRRRVGAGGPGRDRALPLLARARCRRARGGAVRRTSGAGTRGRRPCDRVDATRVARTAPGGARAPCPGGCARGHRRARGALLDPRRRSCRPDRRARGRGAAPCDHVARTPARSADGPPGAATTRWCCSVRRGGSPTTRPVRSRPSPTRSLSPSNWATCPPWCRPPCC